MSDTVGTAEVEAFIERWSVSGGGERSNYQLFLTELCALLRMPGPEPAVEDESQNAYVFERRVSRRRHDGPTTANFIDLYKRHCFVLEAKQSAKRQKQFAELRQLGLDLPDLRVGSGRREGGQWDTVMRHAREQAETYAKNLPIEEGWPPFLVIVDVGHVIELYADFSLQGKHYAQFPDRRSYRVYLEDLRVVAIRERLRKVWADPNALDPARRSAEVTREIAELLAKLSQSLETRLERGLPSLPTGSKLVAERRAIAEKVALFLMRCLFTMFAEDVALIERDKFSDVLKSYVGKAENLHIALTQLWNQMNTGGFSPILQDDVLRFNGGLFKDAGALPVTEGDLRWLIIAAERKWNDVEPAIFGTLLERALDARDRHRLGAHYTPRAYVERLVVATIIDPITKDWRDAQAAAVSLWEDGNAEAARRLVRDFHSRLCGIRVLDPACGTGNFLYVSLELIKRIEGEVLETLSDLGEEQYLLEMDRHTVDPHQFLGLEINPRAVAIAELVLWIGYLQWHFRTRGRTMPAEPVLKNFANIKEQDAVIAYDKAELLRDGAGRPLSRWDGVSTKLHPITGEVIPDPDAQKELYRYENPKPATWPEADFIVGNPPFIGGKDMRQELGDGYAEACWRARPHISGGADFVMHFWDKAAEAVRTGRVRRMGFITTNSITQTFSRRVIEHHMTGRKPLSLIMAIPDHPWLKSVDKAAVRIAMTVGEGGNQQGALRESILESALDTDAPRVELSERWGNIGPDLDIGPDVTSTKPLKSNAKICSRGVSLHGAGFVVTPAEAAGLGLGKIEGLEKCIRPYRNGRDLTARPRGVMVIDLYPLSEVQVRDRFPAVYQWITDRVKPERDQNNRKSYRDNWWIFGEPRRELRPVLEYLNRYIATVETSKHRFFQFLDAAIRPDNKLINIGLEDAFFLGILSSRIHVTWALKSGGRLGVGNDPVYVKTRCFDAFPFPDAPDELKRRIRDVAERLDAQRRTVLEQHKQLSMTSLYNVLEKVRAGKVLNDAEKDVYDVGLIGVLRQLHDDLDTMVANAYGWPADLSDETLLENLVALNHKRCAEEREGKVRWLRPALQAPKDAARTPQPKQLEADLVDTVTKIKKPRLPTSLPDQVSLVRTVLAEATAPMKTLQVARCFSQGKKVESKVDDILRTLTLLGQVEQSSEGYVISR